MSIKIIKPGIFTTIQDMGRNGYRCDGIGPAGAMDFFAAALGNILLGNDENYPVIEMHFPAAELLFEEDILVSITGADFCASVDDIAVELWKPVLIKRQQTLCFKKYKMGARAYLSLQGEMKADKWLNSYSTNTKLKAGGYHGRPLIKGDSILIDLVASAMHPEHLPDITNLLQPIYEPAGNIRCIVGPEWNSMDDASQKMFLNESFLITTQSDRMGYRLQGANLHLVDPAQLISSPVDKGTLQLLPNGQIIVLMADHQTTGGYPRIANVISADLPKLAQQAIHSKLQFELVNIETAEYALLSLYQLLESIQIIHEADRHQL
ncbi:MAG: biotin-dependent carboxyltransferase family protein [Ferruginibacter sp.]|nr:biotin-dependent carboxyltransferase family protein [Ferruginibacter sp.]